MTNTMKSVQNMGYESYLTKDYQAGTDTTITVHDASILPSAPSSVCISSQNKEDSVVVTYTAVTGNVLTVGSIAHYSRNGAQTTKYIRGCIVYKEFSDTVSGGGGSGGTTDYNLLNNKPQINNIELIGKKSAEDLGLVPNTFGVTEADKVLTIGSDGKVFANLGTNVSWSNIVGDITKNEKLQEELGKKVNTTVTGGSTTEIKSIGLNAAGELVYETA